jgi:hypothetical protein
MIRREEDGQLYLIAQDDHATLSGQLAQRIGNDQFQSLPASSDQLADKALTAIAKHDCGWPIHDVAPTLNNRMLPCDVFESRHDTSIKIWTASAERAQEVDPYVGLLVSLHGLSLSAFAIAEVMQHVSRKAVAYTRERFDLNRFQHNEIDRQQSLRAIIGLRSDLPLYHGLPESGADPREDLLIHHFRTLQAMDRLSLALCCTKSPFDHIDLPKRVGEIPSRIKIKRVAPRTLAMDPWPFTPPKFTATTPAHVLPMKQFVGEAELHGMFAEAPIETMTFTIEPGSF